MENQNTFKLYQQLFDHMANEHGINLTISEMDEIILKSIYVSNALQKEALKPTIELESINLKDINIPEIKPVWEQAEDRFNKAKKESDKFKIGNVIINYL